MMTKFKWLFLPIFLMTGVLSAQDQSPKIDWQLTAEKISTQEYRITFTTNNEKGWEIFSPEADFEGIKAAQLILSDSTITIKEPLSLANFSDLRTIKSQIFDGRSYPIVSTKAAFQATIQFASTVPAQFIARLSYSFGNDAKGEFYQEEVELQTNLEGGVQAVTRMLIPGLDLGAPKQQCAVGEANESGNGPMKIFLLGFLGGLFALLTPCVFPMIPLTVSYFTKHSDNKKKGKQLAIVYGLFIFLIYVSFSIPFHLIGNVSPTIYNDISTNVYLNVAFFAIFIFFAISFFGYYEITLPGNLANSANAKQGSGIAGVFFMALTLAIVSFSCTGPILGTLLVGTATEGAWPLTAGLAGFGVALGLPFGLFALFPQWLNSLPKSGSWLNTVKVVLGFIELALALKFLSNADLVAHWSIIKREIFFGIWILIFLGLFIYLMGWLHFPHDSKGQKISWLRKSLAFVVLAFTLYIMPGITNTKSANISLVSGFPPPVCYSLYNNPVNCDEPLKDYEEALKLAKEQGKPILIDFTGWACVNCRKMEENVWTKPEVRELMEKYILVSLYVDDKQVLPSSQQMIYTTKSGTKITIKTIGDKWSLFQTENFNATSQPWYVAISPDEKLLTSPVGYTPDAARYAQWLKCGLEAMSK
ncbi:MAG: protein-disulfide reductase DsbD family protein [Chitinophagia bacterium]